MLIINKRKNSDVVIGVPHHAPAGTTELPCPEHRNSDENTGYLGKYIAEKLNCNSIIACNYTMDANKNLRNDYCIQFAKWNPKYIVEIHGHSQNSANFDIEISSGKNKKTSEDLAIILNKELLKIHELKNYTISGDYNKIKFKASNSVTINDKRWKSFHIELPPSLRMPKNSIKGKPNPKGYKFCECLVESLKEFIDI